MDVTGLEGLAIQCEATSGHDRELDEVIMGEFFRREERNIGCQEEQDDGSWLPVNDSVWVDPATDEWVGTAAREFTSSLDDVRSLGGTCVFASDIGADGMAMVKLVRDTSSSPVVEYTGISSTLERAWLAAALRSHAAPTPVGAA